MKKDKTMTNIEDLIKDQKEMKKINTDNMIDTKSYQKEVEKIIKNKQAELLKEQQNKIKKYEIFDKYDSLIFDEVERKR